ncbi:MAG TPA: glycoside hydrolase family 2 protein [Thermoguttaceae bacterium]|nr:glycoside hydrolase family 2 protein [Thermoguttaceae bacterium]
MSTIIAIGSALVTLSAAAASGAANGPSGTLPARMQLREGWLLKSSYQMKEEGDTLSTCGFTPQGWHSTRVPSTVLNTLTKNAVYPDVRIGLNSFRIPDASDQFNQEHDLAKFSHLPDRRNPWKDPYWYRTEFTLPEAARGRRVWLNFDGIHYRADVWLNGRRVADSSQVVGSFSRYRFDVTDHVRFEGARQNCLAVKIHQMDHPGTPETQLVPFGKDRKYQKEGMQDVGLAMFIGYDCMGTVPDRNIGLWQDVSLEFRGLVEIRDPFVVTQLPLPQTSPAALKVTAVLVNSTGAAQEGVLKGTIEETGGQFETSVRLAPGETKQLVFAADEHPALRIQDPRLWWPRNYGPQNLYHLVLRFEAAGQVADQQRIAFGIRQVTRELHKLDGAHGLRVHVNGQKVFCRGGYIQPELLFDWDAKRIEAEIRYLAEANINIVYFEDIPNPPDVFLDLCDKYGLMFGNCFYGCYWMLPGSNRPLDTELLARGTIDIIHRYRNHPSLVLYMAMNEGETREDVYTRWRKEILDRDGTRLFIPSGSFPDYRTNVPAWIKPDLPTGANDYPPKSYGWVGPSQYFHWVREQRNWMFMLESGCPSPPPYDSLRRFLPDLDNAPPGPTYPVTAAWAHHDACHYFGPYDAALRKLYGQPQSVLDYLAKAAQLTANEHRAMYEAANHRLWDITSGFSEWKLNAAWPSVEWQLYDWYLRPTVAFYYVKKACEPVHVQLTPLDGAVTVVNNRLEPQGGLEVRARVYDFGGKLRWEKAAKLDMPANCYREVFTIPGDLDLTPVYFVALNLRDRDGNQVSDNFYWLTSKDASDLAKLDRLPPVRLDSSCELQRTGQEWVARVRVTNRTDQVAFFAHLVLTKGPRGEEILPVLWDDNYFSLPPGESKQVTVRVAAEDVGEAQPALELGGWNIETDYRCMAVEAAKGPIKANQPVTVSATISDTFLGGSRVTLLVDGQPASSQWAWARGEHSTRVSFAVSLPSRGTHQLAVGRQTITVNVE